MKKKKSCCLGTLLKGVMLGAFLTLAGAAAALVCVKLPDSAFDKAKELNTKLNGVLTAVKTSLESSKENTSKEDEEE